MLIFELNIQYNSTPPWRAPWLGQCMEVFFVANTLDGLLEERDEKVNKNVNKKVNKKVFIIHYNEGLRLQASNCTQPASQGTFLTENMAPEFV